MLFIICSIILIVIGTLATTIAFGGGAPPVPLASISSVFENVDFSDLPAAETIAGRGGSIAFRVWRANPRPLQ